jgi:hypothetical protein
MRIGFPNGMNILSAAVSTSLRVRKSDQITSLLNRLLSLILPISFQGGHLHSQVIRDSFSDEYKLDSLVCSARTGSIIFSNE